MASKNGQKKKRDVLPNVPQIDEIVINYLDQLCDGAFSRMPNAPAPDVRDGQNRCGFCGGSLYLELEDTLSVSAATHKAGGEAGRLAS